jgi:hypothetical protein
VADEHVADGRLPDGVVGRQDRAAGKAEDDVHAAALEASDEGLGSGDLHVGSRWLVVERATGKKKTSCLSA